MQTHNTAIKSIKTLCIGGIVAASSLVAILPASAEDNARIKSKSFNVQNVFQESTIKVISTDGETWNAIQSGPVKLWIDAKIDVRRGTGFHRGHVAEAGLFLGQCSNSGCGVHPLLERWIDGKDDWRFQGYVSFNANKISYTKPGGGIPTTSYGNQIINACNQYLDDGPRVKRTFTWPVRLTMSANTVTSAWSAFAGSDFNGGDVNMHNEVRLGVECVPYETMVPGADPINVSMDLDVAGGNSCPRNVTVKTSITYNYPKTAKFDIVRNGKVLKTVEIKAKRVPVSHGPTQWVIHRQDQVEAKAGQNMFRVVVKGGGKSALKMVDIECQPFQVLFSDLKYNVADGGACPKQVWETATFTATGPGQATMQLVQENGHVFYEKKLETILKNGKYKLVGQRVLNIDRDTNVKFRAQIKGSSGIHSKWAKLKVTCPKRTNPKAASKSGSSNVSAAPQSSSSANKPKKIVCKGGQVKNGKCACPKGTKREKIANSKFHCKVEKRITPQKKKNPVRTNPKQKQNQLICKGGKIKNNKCRCGPNKVRKKVENGVFRCVKKN